MSSKEHTRFPKPTPSRTVIGGGAGWLYGVGCGIGPFLGMGIATTPGPVLFGAGFGVGAYCGVGFGAGVVTGVGTFYVPFGITSRDVFNPPPRAKMVLSNVKSNVQRRVSIIFLNLVSQARQIPLFNMFFKNHLISY